jgi:L-aminopeptidase/D-esterase-like protein
MLLSDGMMVGALVVVNAVGDVIDPGTQQVVAGTRNPGGNGFTNPFSNTTIAVIATNAALSKEGVNKVAQMAHDGMAQALRPAHTMNDGDTVFALALGSRPQLLLDPNLSASQINTIGAAAARTLARAIVRAVRIATDLHGVPAAGSQGR